MRTGQIIECLASFGHMIVSPACVSTTSTSVLRSIGSVVSPRLVRGAHSFSGRKAGATGGPRTKRGTE